MLSGCLPSQAPIPSRWIIDPHEQEDCGSCISGSAFCSLSGAAQHPVVSNEPGICICCCIKSLWIPSQWYEYALPPNPPPPLTSSVTLVGQGLHSICSWSATKFWTHSVRVVSLRKFWISLQCTNPSFLYHWSLTEEDAKLQCSVKRDTLFPALHIVCFIPQLFFMCCQSFIVCAVCMSCTYWLCQYILTFYEQKHDKPWVRTLHGILPKFPSFYPKGIYFNVWIRSSGNRGTLWYLSLADDKWTCCWAVWLPQDLPQPWLLSIFRDRVLLQPTACRLRDSHDGRGRQFSSPLPSFLALFEHKSG